VHIHYRRLPDRTQVYEQRLLADLPEVKVTLQPATPVERPLVVDDTTILEPGSPVVWFTFPDRWHDIGRFHTADDAFTGLYANILTPARLERADDGTHHWHTTDLFLDVWLPEGGEPRVLDGDQFDEALARDWLDQPTAQRARAEVDRILTGHAAGSWPPPIVADWPLARARARAQTVS
jgi:predicted RNA-binding protein associated with RNAse of E/G family